MMYFIPGKSQVITDSLANDFRAFAAKNFSRYRTVNLFWETKWAHDYTFCLDGQDVEKRRKKDLHTIKFSTMIPVLKLKRTMNIKEVLHPSFYLTSMITLLVG